MAHSKKQSTPSERITRLCILFQCFSIGSWLTLLLVKFMLDFPFSSQIGTCAMYVTAMFVLLAMGAIAFWYQKVPRLQPKTSCIKDTVEVAHHLFNVITVMAGIAAALLLAALVMMVFFHISTTSAPVERYLTNWPLYMLSLCWLGYLAYYAYDLVSMRLWKNLQTRTEIS